MSPGERHIRCFLKSPLLLGYNPQVAVYSLSYFITSDGRHIIQVKLWHVKTVYGPSDRMYRRGTMGFYDSEDSRFNSVRAFLRKRFRMYFGQTYTIEVNKV